MTKRIAILAVALLSILGAAAADNRVPTFDEITEFTADPARSAPSDHFKDFRIAKEDFKVVLRYRVVARDQRLSNYSHVAFADRTGTIVLKDKTVIR